MPLKKPARRKHIHTRDVRCHGYQREDGKGKAPQTQSG